MKDAILTFSVLLLPALFIFAAIVGVRWIVRNVKELTLKILLLLGLIGVLVFISFVSWIVIYYAGGGH